MWLLVTKKTHKKALQTIEDQRKHEWAIHDADERAYIKVIGEYERRWGSDDGKVVLNALQDALRMIVEYQRSLAILAAADPHFKAADKLLERWGIAPYKTGRIIA